MADRHSHARQYAKGTDADAGLTIVWQAAVAADKEYADFFAGMCILARNTDGANPYTVTITSQPDDMNRSDDITAFSLAAGAQALFGPFNSNGWRSSAGQLLFEANNAKIEFAVLDFHTL